MVRLRLSRKFTSSATGTNFNSCMVRLRLPPAVVLKVEIVYFNSCMVRLRQITVNSDAVLNVGFQFLYGTIKT